jgi:beta-mannanase
MNGSWFEWDGAHNGKNPAAYAKAFRRIHKIFREHGADNVAFVWSPNWNSGPNVSWNRMERYYPGDAYVDWVGVSAYNFDGESPSTLLKHIVAAYGERRPVMLTETAAIEHGGRSKAEWIGALSAYVRGTPAVSGVVWFDTDVQEGSKHNFRFDSNAASLAAYRTMARSPRFAG